MSWADISTLVVAGIMLLATVGGKLTDKKIRSVATPDNFLTRIEQLEKKVERLDYIGRIKDDYIVNLRSDAEREGRSVRPYPQELRPAS